ncbi:MAG: epoxyqueuosine reductase [Thermodesulfobacteriota bacterium]
MERLTQHIKDLVECLGGVAVGIATAKTLEGGPPSSDLRYVLSEARSAIVFAVALDRGLIEPFLKKEDHHSHTLNNVRANTLVSGIAFEVANFLTQIGHPSVPQAANFVYRADAQHSPKNEKPPISHRYLAVRSGIGSFGYSGNVITKEHGAAIILGSVVSTADLIPTDPLPVEDNYCDECRICQAVCASGYMSADEKVTVSLGGIDFSYCKKRDHLRCDYVCGGFTGLHRSGKWSTWSPGRFPIPENDEDFRAAIRKAAKAYVKRPKPKDGFYHFLMPGYRIENTCGNCQLVCHPDKEIRKRRYKMVVESGVVVQRPDGSREKVSPEEAKKRIAKMDPETRALYEEMGE